MRTAIRIAQPCHENWNDMSLQTGGRHCDSCQKVVHDFTKMNDEELIAFMKTSEKGSCGRFREDQVFSKRSFFYNFRLKAGAFAAVMLAKMFSPGEMKAQEVSNTVTTDPDNSAIHKNVYGDSVVYHITGLVTDKKTGAELSYATVRVQVNGKPAGGSVYTDDDGRFELNVVAGNSDDKITLIFSKRRHKDHTIKDYTPDGQELHVRMHQSWKQRHQRERMLMGAYSF